MKDMDIVRSNIAKFLFALLFASCIQTIAVNSNEFDQNDETIKQGNSIIAKAQAKADSTNNLLRLIMQSLLLDYHNTKTDNQSQVQESRQFNQGQLKEMQLKIWIQYLADGHEAFPIKTMRTIITKQLHDPIFKGIVDLEKCSKIFHSYTDTMKEMNQLIIFSTIYAFICSSKFLLNTNTEDTIRSLLDIINTPYKKTLFSSRDGKKERKHIENIQILYYLALEKIQNPSQKAKYMNIFSTLNCLHFLCTKEMKLITADNITYRKGNFNSNIEKSLPEDTLKSHFSAIKLIGYNEYSTVMEIILHAYQMHIIEKKHSF